MLEAHAQRVESESLGCWGVAYQYQNDDGKWAMARLDVPIIVGDGRGMWERRAVDMIRHNARKQANPVIITSVVFD